MTTAIAYRVGGAMFVCAECAADVLDELGDVDTAELDVDDLADERWTDEQPGPVEVCCERCGERLA